MILAAWFWLMGCVGCPSGQVPSLEDKAFDKAAAIQPTAEASAMFEVVQPAARDPRWSDAVCNDGTPFALELRDQGSDVWVVSFSGGYFCEDDQVPCDGRARRLTTTLPAEDGQRRPGAREGIFSRNPMKNPVFHDANHVDLHYCSSDLWLGEATHRQVTSGSEAGWYFSGRRNVRAGLEYLKTAGLSPTDRVLVVGYSAGGLGVVGNMDTLLEVFAEQRASGHLKLVLDGSWIPPWDTVGMPRANRWGATHAECEREQRAAGEDPARCVFGPVWWPYVAATQVPVLVQISGQDTTQLPAFGVRKSPDKERWREAVRTSLIGLPWVFSGGRPYHVLTHNQRFNKGVSERVSLERVLAEFWSDAPPRQVLFAYP